MVLQFTAIINLAFLWTCWNNKVLNITTPQATFIRIKENKSYQNNSKWPEKDYNGDHNVTK